MTRRAASLRALLLAAALAGGCSGTESSPWVELARGFRPRTLRDQVDRWERSEPSPTGTRAVDEPFGLGLRHAVRPEDWREGAEPGTWWVELPRGAFRSGGVVPRLVTRDAPALARVAGTAPLEPGQYRVADERLALRLPAEVTAPGGALLTARLENGRDVDGRWQVRVGRHCGWGIPVWSGEREELAADVPPASELSFRFAHGGLGAAEPVRIRVELDGEMILEEALAPEQLAPPQHRVLALPAEGRTGARFAFAVEGPAGMGVFFTPVIGPVERGRPGARPWSGARPDIVLFLIDTFRADNLALYGGEEGLAPNLDRFAASALAFEHARSNAAWTLPSIGTLLTGVFPGQHGATDEDLTLPAFNRTVVEELARAGYRTGAITDDSFFGPVFGLDQGFEWFSEHWPTEWDLDRTLEEARAFVEQDDGRPLFLVVHTYRVHHPYRVGPEEDGREFAALVAEGKLTAGMESPPPDVGREVLMQYREQFTRLYRAGVRDLDRGFGSFLGFLEERRFLEHGYLAVTSDHGEALGENRDFFHGGHLWEVKLRVPLLLCGPGLEPRTVPWVASLVDLAPTFADLARLPVDPEWMGTSLLELDHDRPALAFQLGARSHQVAFLEGAHKVIMTPEPKRLRSGACEEAFDLARDRGEETNLARTAQWPAEWTRRFAPEILRSMEPRGESQKAGVSPELEQELEDIGYGGAEDE